MQTIKITYVLNGAVLTKEFNNDKRGPSNSTKFLEELKKQYLSHPFFTGLAELKKALDKRECNSRYDAALSKKIRALEIERAKYLKENSIEKPMPLKVKIEMI